MKRYVLLLLILFSVGYCNVLGQRVDPVLTALILENTKKAESMYESQSVAMTVISEGHVLINSEVEATKNFQKQFNDYVSSFRNVVSFVAQIYGFYYEIDHLVNNIKKMTDQLGDSPSNAIAVALHANRNDIYFEIIQTAMGIIKNIRQVCFDGKMTEKERIELLFDIRPKLKQLNHKLIVLTKLVKYTTLAHVWYDIKGGARDEAMSRGEVIKNSLDAWKLSGKTVGNAVRNHSNH